MTDLVNKLTREEQEVHSLSSPPLAANTIDHCKKCTLVAMAHFIHVIYNVPTCTHVHAHVFVHVHAGFSLKSARAALHNYKSRIYF